ncbi:hypothetical protein [Ornithinimicrobium tianjinense]|uniref:Uncharacterized protein n=1 Tax=Ornithinimicrobium tianjinense TaxID=1195761 RepID=A0A917F1S1_9MICO|nr:hypothetical protein [Ornithinimicrobium tianjinense]GGF44380.1 hypothetical protein GCM10011366_10110 [Ornithinimicrobium tianjinense]
MSFEDLPDNWPERSLADPTFAADVVDLCVSDADRRIGGLSVLLARLDGALSQPIFVGSIPAEELTDAVTRLVEVAEHLPGVGGVVLSLVRPWGAVSDADRVVHQHAIEVCRASPVPLLGTYVVTRASVTHLPVAEELRIPGDAA